MGKKILEGTGVAPYAKGNNFALYMHDSIEFLKKLPENSIDMIFADPPYNLSNGGFTVHAGKRVSVHKGDWDKSRGVVDDFDFHHNWLKESYRVLKPEGTIWISGTYHSIYQCGYALQKIGYKVLNDISWFKPNASPNLSGRYFTASHETLIWARKDHKAKHTFNYQTMKNWTDNYHKKLKSSKYDIEDWFNVEHEPGKQMRSVWHIGTPKREEKIHGKHPTQKPLALLERVVLSSTKPDAVILDPFTGSSTTGIAALMHGRKFIGIDLEEEFLKLSHQRILDLGS